MRMSILLVPEAGVGAGTGHLRRCIELFKRFAPDAAIYLAAGVREELVRTVTDEVGTAAVERSPDAFSRYRTVVIDRPVVQERDIAPVLTDALVIGLDIGGNGREYVNYTIDIIPRLRDSEQTNVRNLGFLELPRAVRTTAVSQYVRALVSFGGEDPGNLTPKMVRALVQSGGFERQNITVVRGPLAQWQLPEDLRTLDRPSNLKDVLKEYDVVFTSFGLTAFEAAAAGAAVVLLNPTRYHARLGRKVGFPDIGVGSPARLRLRRLLQDPLLARRSAAVLNGSRQADLAQTVLEIASVERWGCPVCRRRGSRAILRQPQRTFYRCDGCGILYRDAFADSGVRYDEQYFFDEYRRQYGRTYLDDYQSIRRVGLRRARRMLRLLRPKASRKEQRPRPQLLDIGCAYGPFLDAARKSGFRVLGIDVAPTAVEYVRNTLRFPAIEGSIEDAALRQRWKPESLDAVSLWYVIEHLEQARPVLRWVGEVVRPGGILAFSTPNARGISGLMDRRRFLRNSPSDHATVWSPVTARRVLRRFGFRVVRTVVTGHHPERFPGCGNVCNGSLLYQVLLAVSRVLRLGDTFEIYARRV